MKREKTITRTTRLLLVYLAIAVMLCGSSLYLAYATPQGATVSGSPSVDAGPNKTPTNRSDLGGRIITINLDLEQQNFAWKAYVGNVTGKYVLESASNFSIYEWPTGTSIDGEVYISRNSSVNFGSGQITCATIPEMVTENTFFGFDGASPDNINGTFNASAHQAFQAGTGNNFAANDCNATALWVNDTLQTPGSSAVFQEVALHDGSNMVYAAIINNNEFGFDNTTQFDFQAIIPENRTASAGTNYYFYVEIGS